MNKKKIIIIAAASLALILIIISVIFIYQKNKTDLANKNLNKNEKVFIPDFLSDAEKAKLSIPADAKIQAVSRGNNGEVNVYRIIKSDADVVDPAKIGPISPRAK